MRGLSACRRLETTRFDTAKPAPRQIKKGADMITLPSTSQAAARLRHLTPIIHRLGERPLFELLRQLATVSSGVIDVAESYARIDASVLETVVICRQLGS